MKTKALLLMLSVGMAVTSCKKNADLAAEGTTPLPSYETTKSTTAVNTLPINIVWDANSRKISDNEYFADYGRINRMANGNLILTYGSGYDASHTRVNVVVRRSTDNGATWLAPQTVMNGVGLSNYSGFCNPEILVMQNGWLMLAFTGKGIPDDNQHDNIQICISQDNGVTWSAPQVVSWGRAWEPAMVQLADGDIEMFFASEAAWFPSSNIQQEILFTHSTNNGTTWTPPKRVAYTSGKRDGMPTPLLLQNNGGIAFAVECVGQVAGPDIIYSSTADRWNQTTIGDLSNGRRWSSASDNINGRAPFLNQINTGETLMGIMAVNGRNTGGDYRKNEQLVYIGNNQAKNFVRANDPWPGLPDSEGTYYSSI